MNADPATDKKSYDQLQYKLSGMSNHDFKWIMDYITEVRLEEVRSIPEALGGSTVVDVLRHLHFYKRDRIAALAAPSTGKPTPSEPVAPDNE